MRRNQNRFGLRMLLLPTIMLILVSFYPLFNSMYLSFTNTNILKRNQDIRFTGIDNFIQFFNDSTAAPSILYSLEYAFACVLISYAAGMFLALLLNRKIRGRAVFRALLLIPWAIPTVVAAANWLWILNDQSGLINIWLLRSGLASEPVLFLADPAMARVTCILVGTWKSYPFMTLSLLAGLQGIPEDVYESAKIDGASGLKSFWYITLPMLKNISMVVVTLMFIWGFNNFDIIYLLTQGGPLKATFTLPIYTYNTAFYRGRMGYASAISMVTLVILSGLCMIYMRVQKGGGED
ncbi:MAG: sugar ABC transporter permease [Dorea sp.]|jgi:multiple sugar transport system permease protein|nr:sugar ABC transporter permease [Dorea sp.]